MADIHQSFDSKWKNVEKKKKDEEWSIFVAPGKRPRTQRQFNLFNYYEFIHSIIKDRGYTDAIEIGCGRGTIALYLAIYEKLRIICNDNEESAIAVARKNFDFFNAKAEFIVSDAGQMPLQNNSVGVAASIGLLEHLTDYSSILKEQFRILRPGGVIISLNIPKKHSIQDLNKVYRFIYRIFRPSYPLKPDYFRNTDTPEDYARKAREAGFSDVYTINVNSFPLFTPLHPTLEPALTFFYRFVLGLRRIFMKYPFKATHTLSQAHFVVGFKKADK